MNQCFLEGKVASKPEKKNEKAPLQFRLEVWENNQKDYINVVAWGKVAEIMKSKNLKEGDTVFVVGTIKTEKKKYSVKDSIGNDVVLDSEVLMVTKELVEVKASKIRKTN